jgi:hypothetical protein
MQRHCQRSLSALSRRTGLAQDFRLLAGTVGGLRTDHGFFGLGPPVLRRAAHQPLFVKIFKPMQCSAPSQGLSSLARANPEVGSGLRWCIIWLKRALLQPPSHNTKCGLTLLSRGPPPAWPREAPNHVALRGTTPAGSSHVKR